MSSLSANPQNLAQTALDAIEIETEALKLLREDYTHPDKTAELTRAIATILETSGRVIITGVGKSGHIGNKMAATFASTGTTSYFVHASEASHGDLGMIRQEDVIIALSWSGESQELQAIITYAKRFNVPLIALTSGEKSALARQADVALILPKVDEACPNGLAPTSSTLIQLAMGDALAVAVLKAKGFSKEDFSIFHPGGKLGAQLMKIKDIMHKGDALPLILPEQTMGEALIEMSQKGFGAVIVTSKTRILQGLITDGDLRRHMSENITAKTAKQIMTQNPATLTEEHLASQALQIMNSRRITSMIVTDENRIIKGFVHLHDLLRMGVA